MKLLQRTEYQSDLPSLNTNSSPENPLTLFKKWYKKINEADPHEANIMIIASVNTKNIPSQRAVLLREVWNDQFVFYTNYESAKANDFAHNKKVSLLFYWREHHRQVRINGSIKKIPREKSEKYFSSRPLESKVSSAISKQSKKLQNRDAFVKAITTTVNKCRESKTIDYPLPKNWGGYGVSANKYEFWQGRPSRIHERVLYSLRNKANNSWSKNNIYP